MNNQKACSICGEETQEVKKSLRIFGQYICRKCEEEIVQLSVSDAKYEHYKNAIKTILKSQC